MAGAVPLARRVRRRRRCQHRLRPGRRVRRLERPLDRGEGGPGGQDVVDKNAYGTFSERRRPTSRHADGAREVASRVPGRRGPPGPVRSRGVRGRGRDGRGPRRRAGPGRPRAPARPPAHGCAPCAPPRGGHGDDRGRGAAERSGSSVRPTPAAARRRAGARSWSRSARPRSFQCTTTSRIGPEYGVSAHTGTGGTPSSRSSRGAPCSTRVGRAVRRSAQARRTTARRARRTGRRRAAAGGRAHGRVAPHHPGRRRCPRCLSTPPPSVERSTGRERAAPRPSTQLAGGECQWRRGTMVVWNRSPCHSNRPGGSPSRPRALTARAPQDRAPCGTCRG